MNTDLSPELLARWEPVIGLEVHAQLATKTKMFCRCRREYGAAPNSNTCPVCLGYPGSLPVLNKKALEFAVRLGLALGCTISTNSRFARKNYFYPDLPRGYQISQFEEPICEGGSLTFRMADDTVKRVGITRAHLEDDAGKNIHGTENDSYVDLNRAGTPLIEIVSEPDLRSPEEAHRYLEHLKQILEYTGVSEADMEKGNLRCDANISIRPRGATKLGVRTEMKNLNSFRGVERGLRYEIGRQIDVLENGGTINQCTLLWDDASGRTQIMRSKEEANDYRYFPEPDLVPMRLTTAEIKRIADDLPELPAVIEARFMDQYQIKYEDVRILTRERELAAWYEAVVKSGSDPAEAARWVLGEVLRVLNEEHLKITDFPFSPERLSALILEVDQRTINRQTGKTIFEMLLSTTATPSEIIAREGLGQVSDSSDLGVVIDTVLSDNSQEVDRFQKGEKQLLGFFMGQTMAATRGQGDPKIIRELLQQKLAAGSGS